ncbi:MAG: hypothetical protein E7244_27225 [Enterocloster citroniae]|nr:hypothetical protein [Enterocloster citroniae]
MKGRETGKRVCPRCGREYYGRSALSRADGRTPLCPDCGTREALESIGVDVEEQDSILAAIHGCRGTAGHDD